MLLAGTVVARAAPTTVDDGDAWLVAHGSKDPEKRLQNACCCVEVGVGRRAERALDCKEEEAGGHAESADIAVKEVIRVVRGGKVVKVLEGLGRVTESGLAAWVAALARLAGDDRSWRAEGDDRRDGRHGPRLQGCTRQRCV